MNMRDLDFPTLHIDTKQRNGYGIGYWMHAYNILFLFHKSLILHLAGNDCLLQGTSSLVTNATRNTKIKNKNKNKKQQKKQQKNPTKTRKS